MSPDPKRVQLVIADDHPIVLEGIARVLEAESDFDLRAKGSSGTHALRALREYRPEVPVLDFVMADMSGVDALACINSEALGTKVIFLTANATDAHILALIEKGARGLLMKDTAISELPLCIRKVAW